MIENYWLALLVLGSTYLPNDVTHRRQLNFYRVWVKGRNPSVSLAQWVPIAPLSSTPVLFSVDLVPTRGIFLRHSYSLRKGRISMYLRPKTEAMSMWSRMFCAIYFVINHVCSIGDRDIILPDAAWNILCRSNCVFRGWKCIFWLYTQVNVQIEVITYVLVKLFRSFGKILSF